MPYAIELLLDDDADQRVRDLWRTLAKHGLPALGTGADATVRPHVTLSVFDDADPDAVAAIAAPIVGEALGVPLRLASLGFFLTGEGPAFLGAVVTERLLRVHRALDAAMDALVPVRWEFYRPDALVPHCTLAMRVAERGPVADVVAAFGLPIEARAAGAVLVEIHGGREIPLA